MRYIRTIDTEELARRDVETFKDRGVRRKRWLENSSGRVGWPLELQRVGRCLGVAYSSDKWHDIGDYEDYKHIAEAPQNFYCTEGFIRDWDGEPVDCCGPMMPLPDRMPGNIAELADFLMVQVRLYAPDDGGRPYLPNGDDGLMQLHVPRGKLGGCRMPYTETPFLVVFNSSGIHCMITGRKLDVEKDGITG